MSEHFDGDMMIFLTFDGAEIYENSGNIHTDSSVLNMITMLLFLGNKNRHYSVLMKDSNYKYESKTPEILKKPITVTMLRDLDSAIRSDLSYLTDKNIIVLENVYVKNTGPKQIEIEITVFINHSKERVRRIFQYKNGFIESVLV